MKSYFLASCVIIVACQHVCAEELPLIADMQEQQESTLDPDDSFFDMLAAASLETKDDDQCDATMMLLEAIATEKAAETQHSYFNRYITPYLASLLAWYAQASAAIQRILDSLYQSES